ncbi:MAG: O-acetyl-ADP-ribose deacetylase [Bacteroidales bacterium]|jgi:O-acetyl-ADP-ribose deacetylase (regulator of RNase III)|nr:O-acetyl-ADP-ribose deacetylase [Bacteroidales bacterium]MDD4673561.1 O-acetyl-ADP-ribose deacetylase [Bacteroidales bacterium]MDY0349102.1 O-acetyl-ADP-ribose deacetylase [Tenuifilaceae bacterium]
MPKKKFDETQLFLVKGDITAQKFDAIVNAANTTLLGGGGVDGAIHRAAGPELLEECKTIGGCPTGEARITKGYNLISPYIIHTVGPVWHGGTSNEQQLLQNAYESSLKLAKEHGIQSIAFPNISTGVYGFPKLLAAKIAVETVSRFLSHNSTPHKVTFVCFDDENLEIYKELLGD